jgi:phenylalanyl-tRNA synthetase alpha chain
MTYPVGNATVGHIHPITQAYFEIVDIFGEMGFSFAEGPEVEWFWYAFESLNMPITHPASDDFETYYLKHDPHEKYGRMLLRPHTSPVQVRTMLTQEPPIRVVVPGKTYRPNYDTSHTPMFHQFEGLLVDKNVSIGQLVGTLDYFVKKFFGPELKVRIRPYHFQFTEPSFEVDITCSICKGEGCRLCKEGWLELGGSGMVHPTVLENGGINSQEYNGFAFGWGIERCVNIRSGIPDVRMIYEGELRLLEQF